LQTWNKVQKKIRTNKTQQRIDSQVTSLRETRENTKENEKKLMPNSFTYKEGKERE